MDRLARSHREFFSGDFERDVVLRHQMHLDPRELIVPAGLVLQLVHRNGAVQLPVDATREIEIEFRRHPPCIVIRRFQHGDVLDEVHPHQQHGTFAQRLAHGAQKVGRGARDHVAQSAAREEAQLGQVCDFGGQFDPAHEVRLYRMDRQAGELGGKVRRRSAQEIARNVQRHVGRRLDGAQQCGGLHRGAAAEFHHRAPFPDRLGKVRAARFQDLGFRARRIIFRHLRDILVKLRARIVVQPARGDRLLRLAHARQHVGAEGAVDARLVEIDELEAGIIGHQMSFASLRPVNCQRWCG